VKSFSGEDINSVYLNALIFAADSSCTTAKSRCGTFFDFGAVFFEFKNPVNQLLLLDKRKFNPFFAVVESAWVLSGRNQLSDLQTIISKYAQFSDDGNTLNGAYGFRMQNYFEIDQLESLITLFKKDKETRRAVITLYGPNDLINNDSLDIPCNTSIFFKIRNSKLDITIINRSNDLYLGIPYNIFVFNVLQQYIANRLGIEIGVQRHFTDCLHLYERDLIKIKEIIRSNSQLQVNKWREESSGTERLIEGILESFNEISTLDIDNISNPYCKQVFGNYLRYKKNNEISYLTENIPKDIFGLSTTLWLNAISST